MLSSRGSSRPRDWTQVTCIAGGFFTIWATREAHDQICSNLCPLSQWRYLIISCSATFFSFCLQSLPPSVSFPVSWLLASDAQIIEASMASVLPMSIQGWFPLGLTGLITLLSKRLSRVFSSTTIWKHQFFSAQPSLWSSSHIHSWLLERP